MSEASEGHFQCKTLLATVFFNLVRGTSAQIITIDRDNVGHDSAKVMALLSGQRISTLNADEPEAVFVALLFRHAAAPFT